MIQTIIAAILSYISTEIDDLLMAVLLFSNTKTRSQKAAVTAGMYAALAVIVCGSAFFAVYLEKLDAKYIGILGLVPIALAIKETAEGIHRTGTDNSAENSAEHTQADRAGEAGFWALSSFTTALVTLGDSGDNIAVYIPLFASMRGSALTVTIIVYALMQALWCTAAYFITNAPPVKAAISKWRRVLVPVVYFLLGVWILLKNGTVQSLISLIK